MTGAAYASSSANALPSSTFPPTIASFGFIHQPAAADIKNNSALLDTDGLTAGRGCPVGDAAADKSPVLLPSPPEQRNELQDSLGTPHPLHFQASSTPLVRQVLPLFRSCHLFLVKVALASFPVLYFLLPVFSITYSLMDQ